MNCVPNSKYGRRLPGKLPKLLPLCLTAVLLTAGCARNPYNSAYRESAYQLPRINRPIGSTVVEEDAPIRLVETEDEYLSIVEEGFLPLGYSHLVGRHMGWYKMLQVSAARGGDLIVINEIFRPTHRDETVTDLKKSRCLLAHPKQDTLPVDADYNRSVPANLSRKFSQTAVLMKKIDVSQMYGVVLGIPPTNTPEYSQLKNSDVWVLAVMNGSQAEKDGVRRGDRVIDINGVPVKSSKVYGPYLFHPQAIRTIKTEPKNKGGLK